MPKVLVTSGNIGNYVAEGLAKKGVSVRVLQRSVRPNRNWDSLGIGQVAGDFGDVGSLSPAFDDVDRFFSVSPMVENLVEHGTNAARAAKEAGVDYIVRFCSGNASALARMLHVGRGAVSKWQREKTIPELTLLLSLSYRLGTSLGDLLLGCPAPLASARFVRHAPVEVNARSQTRRRAHGRRIRGVEVSRILHAALRETPPPSMDQVIKRFSYSGPTIYRHVPELCRQIARHYAEYRVRRAIARKVQAGEEVRRVACELQAQGISLTRRNLRPQLTSTDYLNLEEGRAALREVRQQRAPQICSE